MTTLHLVFGMARSGTSFLARALETVPGVAVFGESDFFGRSYTQPGADGNYDRRAIARLISTQAGKEWTLTTGERDQPLTRIAPGVYGRLVAEALGELERTTPTVAFRAIADAVARHTGCDTVIEKTPGHLLFIERVDAALPDVRGVATYREPAGFLRSFVQLDARDPSAAMRLLGRVSRHTALGVLMWRSYMRALERARACMGARLLVLSHAELARAPEAAVARAASHFGIETPHVDLRALPRNASADPRRGTPTDLRLWLQLLASELARDEAASLPPTNFLQGLRSLATLAPSSAFMLARVLPQARRIDYVREYMRGGSR